MRDESERRWPCQRKLQKQKKQRGDFNAQVAFCLNLALDFEPGEQSYDDVIVSESETAFFFCSALQWGLN